MQLSLTGAWVPQVHEILGESARLLYCGLIVAMGVEEGDEPEAQQWHMDGDNLFEDEVNLPCHCLTVFVPLVDLVMANGPTEFCLGTHLHSDEYPNGEVCLEAVAGSAILFDYRLLHRGTPNHTAHDRPILYYTYSKPWYRDPVNYRYEQSKRSIFAAVTEEEQLAWAKEEAQSQQKEVIQFSVMDRKLRSGVKDKTLVAANETLHHPLMTSSPAMDEVDEESRERLKPLFSMVYPLRAKWPARRMVFTSTTATTMPQHTKHHHTTHLYAHRSLMML